MKNLKFFDEICRYMVVLAPFKCLAMSSLGDFITRSMAHIKLLFHHKVLPYGVMTGAAMAIQDLYSLSGRIALP